MRVKPGDRLHIYTTKDGKSVHLDINGRQSMTLVHRCDKPEMATDLHLEVVERRGGYADPRGGDYTAGYDDFPW